MRKPSSLTYTLMLCVTALGFLGACKGSIKNQPTNNNQAGPNNPNQVNNTVVPNVPGDPGVQGATLGGLKLLNQREYNRTVSALLGLDGDLNDVPELEGKTLPLNGGEVFGNSFQEQKVSEVMVKGAGTFAQHLATYALGRPAIKAKLVPCTPQGSDDEACFTQFIDAFSQRALRRPMEPSERTHLMGMFAYGKTAKDFDVALQYSMEYFLQHAEFLYRNEQGQPLASTPEIYALTDFQIATKMAFALWGEGPDDWLLQKANAGELKAQQSRQAIAKRMLDDPRAMRQIQHFHARWLGYDGIQLALPADMRRESDMLIERVISQSESDWRTIFTLPGTYLTNELAAHYSLPSPNAGEHVWTTYPQESGRAGIFSHASFLSVRASVGKTSITKRGKFIAEHLLCKRIADPPPNIDIDERAPGIAEDACKQAEHDFLMDPARAGLCASCHLQMDPLAMGLERFGPTGQYREYEEGLANPNEPRQECKIRGTATVSGIGEFSGPKALGELLTGDKGGDLLASCAVRRAYQFTYGLKNEPIKSPMTDYLTEVFKASGYNWKTMLLAMVSSEAFAHRRDTLDPAGSYWNKLQDAERDPKDVDVEYAIRYTDTPPTVDGSCEEFVGAPVISWTGLNDTNNAGQDCWMTWSKGADGNAILNGCCTVRDTDVVANNTGRSTDHDFSDDTKPNIFLDDHFTYMLSSSGGVFDEKTSQVVLTASETQTAIYDLFYNDGFYEGVSANPVTQAKSSITRDAQGNAQSWTVEYTANTMFAASVDEGLDVLCRFRVTDADSSVEGLKHVLSFGDQNNITDHNELRACRLSTTRHTPVITQ